MDERRRLTYGDRKIIESRLDSGWRLFEIADELDCDPTAVSREVKRNRMALGEVAKSRFRIVRCQKFESCETRGSATPSAQSAAAVATCAAARRSAPATSSSIAARRSASRTFAMGVTL